MEEKARNRLLLIASILITLLIMETLLRLSGVSRMTARFMCFDAVIGKVYCKSAEGTFTRGDYSHHLVINTDGMVDREYPLAKPEATVRIALLGDSFTASEYLDTDDKFEGHLEQSLSSATGSPVEILNFGISASETWDQLKIFHLRAARYRPDVTFLVFFWGNDIRDNIGKLNSSSPNPLIDDYDAPLPARIRELRKNFNKALWNNSLLYQITHDGFGKLERSIKRYFVPAYLKDIDRVILEGDKEDAFLHAMHGGDRPVVNTTYNDDDLFFWDSAGWDITRKLIRKLKTEVEAAGSRLVVMHFPSAGLVRSTIPLPHEEFDAFLDRNGIPYLSLFRDYYGMDPAELRRHFIPVDGHWTRHGHRFVAERAHDLLLDAIHGWP
jgi:hypothetical protein